MKPVLRLPLLLLTLLLLSTASFAQGRRKKKLTETVLPEGLVPDSATARRIAEAIWLPIYGRGVYRYKPFHATLRGDSVWVVQGSLGRGWDGGVPYIEIYRRDARVLQVAHGK